MERQQVGLQAGELERNSCCQVSLAAIDSERGDQPLSILTDLELFFYRTDAFDLACPIDNLLEYVLQLCVVNFVRNHVVHHLPRGFEVARGKYFEKSPAAVAV